MPPLTTHPSYRSAMPVRTPCAGKYKIDPDPEKIAMPQRINMENRYEQNKSPANDVEKMRCADVVCRLHGGLRERDLCRRRQVVIDAWDVTMPHHYFPSSLRSACADSPRALNSSPSIS